MQSEPWATVSGSDSQRYPGADLLMSSVPHVVVVSELLREKHHNGTIWDEEFLQSPKLDSCLLEQLALGVDDEDIKSTLELNSMMSTDSTHVLLDRMPHQDVVWDVELLQGIDCQDGLLQQLVHGVDDHMQCKTGVMQDWSSMNCLTRLSFGTRTCHLTMTRMRSCCSN